MTYILIVEDDVDSAEILSHHLNQHLALPIEHVANGYEVLRMVKNNPPDLIFMDVNLPDDDGRVICNQIKNRLGDNAPKIIVMTAAHNDAQNIVARQMGADDFIGKPLRMNRVIKKAKHYLVAKQDNSA